MTYPGSQISTTLGWTILDLLLFHLLHNLQPLTTPCTSISRCGWNAIFLSSKHLINLSNSTSTPSCIRSRRRTRHQTPLRPSLSFRSSINNLTPTPSLAAGRSLAAIQAQCSSSGEKTVTCLTGRPARRWRALPTFIFGLNRTSCSGYLPTKARLQFVVHAEICFLSPRPIIINRRKTCLNGALPNLAFSLLSSIRPCL